MELQGLKSISVKLLSKFTLGGLVSSAVCASDAEKLSMETEGVIGTNRSGRAATRSVELSGFLRSTQSPWRR